MTRNDAKWAVGMLAAIVTGLATLGSTVVDYGVPAVALPYIRLIALVVGIVSGKLATSPLPGKNDLPQSLR